VTWNRLTVENYRGVSVPRVLGLVLAGAAAISAPATDLVRDVGAAGWATAIGTLLVFAAGLIDDLVPIGPRGIRAHLRSLAEGHMTTGILKLLVAVAASVIVVGLQPVHEGWVRVAGVALVAASTNVGNALDVRPGRALKVFLPVACAVAIAGVSVTLVPVFAFVTVAAFLVLLPDLRERGMLGDGGATLLGFVAGLSVYVASPDWGVVLASIAAVGLNVLADTVTLSRLIEAIPPLRWYDRFGRVRSQS
jgi:UDP-GlcNAc:undecaprenyl-phosphate GlcNAc-1-phosphate transferase